MEEKQEDELLEVYTKEEYEKVIKERDEAILREKAQKQSNERLHQTIKEITVSGKGKEDPKSSKDVISNFLGVK